MIQRFRIQRSAISTAQLRAIRKIRFRIDEDRIERGTWNGDDDSGVGFFILGIFVLAPPLYRVVLLKRVLASASNS